MALPVKTGSRAATSGTANRFEGIMTCQGQPGQNCPELGAVYTARATASVTKARDELNYSPYLPAAGLYSLFSDSFGPVP
jgi:hypothetical protein